MVLTKERLMLSRTAEYALRIMILLTEREGTSLTAEQIAKATLVPAGYTVKVLQQLGRAKLSKGQRGRKGGFVLACNPSKVDLLQVVTVIDPLKRITEFPLGRTEHQHSLCALYKQIDAAIESLQKSLSSMSLKEVVKSGEGESLCQEHGHGNATLSVKAAN
ncbi:MAG: transcriptional regulator [Phycisphaerae bacterium]|nr:transcriptional regulator [Phycisphaerae bacterium]|tara:strand:- start:1341 stop:1826 length:486 start_codon:yes stop_codon:yes gene_type:complete